jgi:hypothetical protein
MYKLIVYIVLIVILIFTAACDKFKNTDNLKDSNFSKIKITDSVCNYYENGNKKNVGYFDGTIRVGKWKEYFSSGKLEREAIYVNDSLNGEMKQYYEDGKVECIINYEDDLMNGDLICYYRNGNLKEKAYYVDGKPFSHSYFYNSYGQLLNYRCFDFEGHLRYHRKYDSLGRIIRDTGSVIGQTLRYENSKYVLFNYAKPPNTLLMTYIRPNPKNLKIDLNDMTGEIYIPDDYNDFYIIGELYNSQSNNLLIKDSINFRISP